MAGNVWIGVTVHADPAALRETLRFLRLHTEPGVALALLPDGPDDETARALADDPVLNALPQWGTREERGGAACLNRLVARSEAGVVVLLESGALVGPRWLDLLVAALRRSRAGLVGPSTNRGWNDQAAVPRAVATPAGVRRAAAYVARRYGRRALSLAPLHSLADFCYVVRREVFDVIGPADEGYGPLPCWEMDFNARAARAGYPGMWVGGAYVHRLPATARRARADADLLDAGRRRYQDRFCGLRALSDPPAYRAHCEGDTCPHFALPEPRSMPRTMAAPAVQRQGLSVGGPSPPMVSCVMPTRGRPEFAVQAVRYFLRQDYPVAELVIVEDGPAELARLLPQDPRIRIVSSRGSRSIGALRNHGTSVARGEFVAHWDDDDWYAPQRLSRQVAPLVAGSADVTALRGSAMLDVEDGVAWQLSDDLHRRMFVRDVHGGTLVFRRRLWDRFGHYPDISLAEDARFLDQVVRRGARLEPISADGLFVYIRHGRNSWRLDLGQDAGWRRVTVPAMPVEDGAFYRRYRRQPRTAPLVSCLMPTADRRPFVALAIEYFRRQDYPHLELVVVDDGTDPVADLVVEVPNARYHRLERRMVLGAKRNLAVELAHGDYLVHWDDDDWQSAGRVGHHMAAMHAAGADVSGARSLYFYAPDRGQGWRYVWPHGRRSWAAGASLCYRRDVWERGKFAAVAAAEDTRFVWRLAATPIADVGDLDCLVALVHPGNTVRKTGSGCYWHVAPVEEIEAVLGPDAIRYRSETTIARAGEGALR